jgi:hypothetical protein
MMTNDAVAGRWQQLLEKGSSFYKTYGEFLKATVVGAGVTLLGVAVFYHFGQSESDSVLRAFEQGRGLEPFDKSSMIDRKALVDNLLPILQPVESSSLQSTTQGISSCGGGGGVWWWSQQVIAFQMFARLHETSC